MTESISPAQPRYAWIDYAKAVGIVLVVIGHASRSIQSSGMTWSDPLRMIDHLIYSFHMPLFFVISGYTSTLSQRRDLVGFLVGTWWGVAFPYLLASLVLVTAMVLAPGVANVAVEPGALLTILWAPIEHLWFLYLLVIARIFWFAVSAYAPPRAGFAVLAGVFAVALYTEYPISMALTYYGAGAMFLSAVLPVQRRSALAALGWAAAFWLIFVLIPEGAATVPHRIATALLGSTAIIFLARAAPDPTTIGRKVVGFIGESSLVIYLLHLYFGVAARLVLKAVGQLNPVSLLVSASVVGIAGPLLVQAMLLKISARKDWHISKWLGLGLLTRSNYFDFSSPKLGIADAVSTEKI